MNALSAALLIALAGFCGGWKVHGWQQAAEDKARMEAAQETERLRARTADTASAGHETAKDRIRTQFQTITEKVEVEIEKPVYRNVCFAPDGLRELATAIAADPAATGQPAPAVPAPERPR
jgi:hypothetical protein